MLHQFEFIKVVVDGRSQQRFLSKTKPKCSPGPLVLYLSCFVYSNNFIFIYFFIYLFLQSLADTINI